MAEQQPHFGRASHWLRIYRRRFVALKEAVRQLGPGHPVSVNLAAACAEVSSPRLSQKQILGLATREQNSGTG